MLDAWKTHTSGVGEEESGSRALPCSVWNTGLLQSSAITDGHTLKERQTPRQPPGLCCLLLPGLTSARPQDVSSRMDPTSTGHRTPGTSRDPSEMLSAFIIRVLPWRLTSPRQGQLRDKMPHCILAESADTPQVDVLGTGTPGALGGRKLCHQALEPVTHCLPKVRHHFECQLCVRLWKPCP